MKGFVYCILLAFLAVQMPKSLWHNCDDDHELHHHTSKSDKSLDSKDCDFCALDLIKYDSDVVQKATLASLKSFQYRVESFSDAYSKPIFLKVSRGPPFC